MAIRLSRFAASDFSLCYTDQDFAARAATELLILAGYLRSLIAKRMAEIVGAASEAGYNRVQDWVSIRRDRLLLILVSISSGIN